MLLSFFILLDALSGTNSETTVMARQRGAPQVVINEEKSPNENICDSGEDQDDVTLGDDDTYPDNNS